MYQNNTMTKQLEKKQNLKLENQCYFKRFQKQHGLQEQFKQFKQLDPLRDRLWFKERRVESIVGIVVI